MNYSYSANPSTSGGRAGTITIAGQTFTLTQNYCGNPYAISPASQAVPSGGGTYNLAITAASGCGHMPWTAVSNASWITGVSPASGTGTGSVSYAVASTTAARTGTISIGTSPSAQTHTVNQGMPIFDILWQETTAGWLFVWYMGGAKGVTRLSGNYLTPNQINPTWRMVGTGLLD